MAAVTNGPLKTVGDLSRLYGVEEWHVRRIADEVAPNPPRVGGYRVFSSAVAAEIAVALKEKGCLPDRGAGNVEGKK